MSFLLKGILPPSINLDGVKVNSKTLYLLYI